MSPHVYPDNKTSANDEGGKTSTDAKAVTDDKVITDNKKWVKGDCVVITSNNVRFRVPSYHLRSASRVFCDMFDLPHGKPTEIILDNEEFETSKVFDAFLKLVVEGEVEVDNIFKINTVALPKFLDKWDCQAALSHYLTVVRAELLDEKLYGLVGFVIGATLDDQDFCYEALGYTNDETWDKRGKTSMDYGTFEATTVDPAHWPLYMWTHVPSEYAAALARAFGECEDKKTIPDVFLKYLQLARAKT